ncbi:MAG: hypothetical protein LBF55_04625 [Prevotellaceae bacterium]|jgi:hypothetical protein|nr:hypothetical protein [Prevotellaceae bacterium]
MLHGGNKALPLQKLQNKKGEVWEKKISPEKSIKKNSFNQRGKDISKFSKNVQENAFEHVFLR